MTTLAEDLAQEKRHLVDLRARAHRRLQECKQEAVAMTSQGKTAAEAGDADGAADFERRVHKLKVRAERYEELFKELDTGGDRLVREVLLARLQGPDLDILVGEVERNRDLIVQRATKLLRARDQHRALRHRWGELTDKIRGLRERSGMPARSVVKVDFRVHVTPQTYKQRPDGPTFRDVSDLVHELGL